MFISCECFFYLFSKSNNISANPFFTSKRRISSKKRIDAIKNVDLPYYMTFDPKKDEIYVFDLDLVWRMQLMIIKGKKFVLCV